jgi:transcriptional regulator with XRE-family HTH domain
MASQRKRLGLSAAECGVLIGASAQSIYNWEEGRARPRVQHLPAIYALRTLGRRTSERDPREPQGCVSGETHGRFVLGASAGLIDVM